MDQPALDSPEDRPESLRALAGKYVNRHSGLQNFMVNLSIEYWLLRRLGIEPLSWQGRLVGGLIWFLMVLLSAVILTAITGQWAGAPLLSWTTVAVAWAGATIVALPLYGSAISSRSKNIATIKAATPRQ